MNGHHEMCWVSGIIIPPNRARADLNEDSVIKLMESIKKIGLQTPVTLTLDEETGVATLIAGAHRLEAVKRLGWQEIPANFVEGWSEDAARMWEIAENLHRADLTALERDEHVSEWIRLAEKQIDEGEAVLAQPAPKLSKRGRNGEGRPESGVRAAARELGVDRDSARRAKKVASLAPEAKQAAKELGLDDNRSALLEAAQHTNPEEQVETLSKRALKKLKVADDPIDDSFALEKQVAKLMSAWNSASPEARQEFLLRIGQ